MKKLFLSALAVLSLYSFTAIAQDSDADKKDEKKKNLVSLIAKLVSSSPNAIQQTVKDKNDRYLGFFIADILLSSIGRA